MILPVPEKTCCTSSGYAKDVFAGRGPPPDPAAVSGKASCSLVPESFTLGVGRLQTNMRPPRLLRNQSFCLLGSPWVSKQSTFLVLAFPGSTQCLQEPLNLEVPEMLQELECLFLISLLKIQNLKISRDSMFQVSLSNLSNLTISRFAL